MKRAPLTVAIVLLSLPFLYVGSYFALVVPRSRMVNHINRAYYCHYRIDSEYILPAVFFPLEQIDRKVRPESWRH